MEIHFLPYALSYVPKYISIMSYKISKFLSKHTLGLVTFAEIPYNSFTNITFLYTILFIRNI